VLTRYGRHQFRLANTEFVASIAIEESTPQRFPLLMPPDAIAEFPRLRGLLQFRNVLQLSGADVGTAALTMLVAAPAKLVVVSDCAPDVDALVEFARYRGVEDRVRIIQNVAFDDRARLARVVEEEFALGELEVVLDDASDDLVMGRGAFDALFPVVAPEGSYIFERWSRDHFLVEGFLAVADPAECDVGQMRVDTVRRMRAEKGAVLEAIVPELLAALAFHPDVVAAMTATKHWLEVRRGPGRADGFELGVSGA
jgi:hypothetical protein